MKNRFTLLLTALLFTALSFGQNKTTFNRVDSLIDYRQPNAAKELLWEIIEEAKESKNNATLIKAFPYFRRVLSPLEKDERAALFNQLLEKSKELPEPSKSITLLQLTTEMVNSYYLWFSYYQPQTSDSISLWNPEVRFNFIYNNLQQLETQLKNLKQYDFKPYKKALSLERDTSFMFRTLADYTVYGLINFYNSPTIKNGGELKMASSDQKEWYGTAYKFGKLSLQDSSLTSRILKLYQIIEQNNIDFPLYLSNAIYQRLYFLKNEYHNSEEVLKSWKEEFDYFKNFSARSKFLFEIERNNYFDGAQYHFKNNPDVEGLIKKAHTNLSAELKKFPKSDFSEKIKGLIKIIEHPEIQLSYPQITPPNQKIPFLITHRNYSNQVLRIYKINNYDPLNKEFLRGYVKKGGLTLIRTLNLELKNKSLYQKRQLEILLEGIPSSGQYILVASKDDRELSKNVKDDSLWLSLNLVYNQITVSSIATSSTSNHEKFTVAVVDQKTGKPIQNAVVECYFIDYGNNYKPRLLQRGSTNKQGVFDISIKRSRSIVYIVRYKESILYTENYTYKGRDEKKHNAVSLFTDRAIYRPGQTIYFKGVAFEGKENEYQTVSNKSVNITLRDASYQEVFNKSFKTNSFGSVDGEIVLPEGTNLGQFILLGEVQGSSSNSIVSRIYFRVEEYKRPTFEVVLNQPKKEAKLNDTVSISGNTTAFAGFPISGAKVTYTVYRKWNRYWRFYHTPSSGDLLVKDTLETDEDGNFNIDFFSATDPNAVKNAYYYYEIKVKATDLSGETHEQSLTLNLSETGLSIQFSLPSEIASNDTVFGIVDVVNLAGKHQEGFNGKLKIYKKISSEKFLNRIWRTVETSKITDEELALLFPYMQLGDQEVNKDLKKYIKTIDFMSGDSLAINKILEGIQGAFVFELETITPEGDTLKAEANTEIINVKAKDLPSPMGLWTYVSSSSAEVGADIDFQVGSSFKNAEALVSFYRGTKLVYREWVNLKNRYSKCYNVKEVDRGMLTFDVLLYYNGKFYIQSERVNVPFSNKRLKITAATFRDLLEPGQKERWSFKIKDNDDKFVNAELAATMYDASLDQIQSNYWIINPYNIIGRYTSWDMNWARQLKEMGSPSLDWRLARILSQNELRIGFDGRYRSLYDQPRYEKIMTASRMEDIGEITLEKEPISKDNSFQQKQAENKTVQQNKPQEPSKKVEPRTNFNETAFFYPTIYTNDSNAYVLNFTLPESLTKWKLLLLAHTQDLKIGTFQKEVEARKELMVTANIPRFVRQGDQIYFSAKVVNLTDEQQTVDVSLKLENPIDNKELNWTNDQLSTSAVVPANSSQEVSWKLNIGQQELMQYTVSVSNSSFSDGERNIVPVLSNRIAVTATDHVLLKTPGKKTHTFDAFKNQSSSTLKNTSYTVEYIDNLAWQAVMALPYLSKMNNQSSISLINSYYANAISEHVVDNNPRIKTIFNQWKSQSPDALMSELEKNKELKNILLKETPWVMEAKNEAEQRRRVAQLFQLNQLHNNQRSILNKLKKRQNSDGGFSWFSGGHSSVYITTLVLNRFGQLEHLGIKLSEELQIIRSAENYLAKKQVERYDDYLKNYSKKKSRKYLVEHYSFNDLDAYWLYSRTFFHQVNSKKIDTIVALYKDKMKKDWVDFTLYGQALAGIYFKYEGMDKEAELVYASFLDRAKKTTNLGTYWVENSGYYWHQNKIGVQAMAISLFNNMDAPKSIMDELRLWLILNKETHAWETGVNTADAVYAILMSGADYLNNSEKPEIKVGNYQLVEHETERKNEVQVDWIPGLGQINQKWIANEITPELGTVSIDKHSESPAVLNLYWQYTEDLSKIKESQNKSMKIVKSYRRIVPGTKAEKGILDSTFNRGDKIEVELIVTVDRDLEFVHIKDLRPAGFEPAMSLSGYHWENNIFYYQSPKDVSMDYFVEHMARGTYKFSYTVYATHSGKFNSGMASIQCLYAPKFTGNSTTQNIDIEWDSE